jgi:peptidoglycan hydrolase-like protein with peptidoglycan-binding domain
VREAQTKLNDMGFHAGRVDGVWGPRTQAAVRNFQQSEDLETTGQLNQETMNALGLEKTGREKEERPALSDQSQTGSAGQAGKGTQ